MRKAVVGLLSVVVLGSACGNSAPPARQASAQTPGSSPRAAGTGEVVAIVDGEQITAGDVDGPIAAPLAKLAEEAYELRRRQIDQIVSERLVAAEAKRRGITPDVLIEREVVSQVTAVTDEDVAAFVAANRHRIQGDPAALTARIKTYLQQQRTAARREAFVNGLKAKSKVEVRLPAPPVYRAAVGTTGPARGPAGAPVTIVEFSDFHCPFCRAVQPTLNTVLAKYPQQVRLVYRHLPLDGLHPQARRASEASWCADQQQKFWAFHDGLYAGGADASDATLRRIASAAGLNVQQFEQCLATGLAAAAVEVDVEEGQRLGLSGTPGFFINGRPLSGNLPLDNFLEIIEEELSGTR